MRTRSIPKSEAEVLLRRIDRRKRNLIAWLCPVLGLLLAEVNLVVWALRTQDRDVMHSWGTGFAIAGFIGVQVGAVSALWIPFALQRKPWKRAFGMLSAISVVGTAAFTLLSGAFPVFIIFIALSATPFGILLYMRNESLSWNPARCLACEYDLSASPPGLCSECGLTEDGVRALANRRERDRPAMAAIIWLGFVTVAWIGIAVSNLVFHLQESY